MSAEENKAIVRQLVAAADKGNFEAAAAFLAPDVIVHMPGAPTPLDRSSFMQFGVAYHSAFPDEQSIFEDQIVEGDTVVSRIASTATHTGEFYGMPPTGKQIRVKGIFIDRIAGGKIVERWVVFDQLGMLQQLGVIPPMG